MTKSESVPLIVPDNAHVDAEHPRTEESQRAYITPEAPPSAQTSRALESDKAHNEALFNSEFTAEFEEYVANGGNTNVIAAKTHNMSLSEITERNRLRSIKEGLIADSKANAAQVSPVSDDES